MRRGTLARLAALTGGIMVGCLALAPVSAQQQKAEEAAEAPDDAAAQPQAEEAAGEEAPWEEHPYILKDGQVDFGTYNGYRRYEAYCLRCHGPDGAGSSYAPALVESLTRLSYEQFLETVVYGRKNISASQQSVMPAFGEAVDVMENIDDIYAYLKARADGVVARGRPDRLPPEEDPVFQERKG
jgi:methanol metabolism-related c-type cytochrome